MLVQFGTRIETTAIAAEMRNVRGASVDASSTILHCMIRKSHFARAFKAHEPMQFHRQCLDRACSTLSLSLHSVAFSRDLFEDIEKEISDVLAPLLGTTQTIPFIGGVGAFSSSFLSASQLPLLWHGTLPFSAHISEQDGNFSLTMPNCLGELSYALTKVSNNKKLQQKFTQPNDPIDFFTQIFLNRITPQHIILGIFSPQKWAGWRSHFCFFFLGGSWSTLGSFCREPEQSGIAKGKRWGAAEGSDHGGRWERLGRFQRQCACFFFFYRFLIA